MAKQHVLAGLLSLVQPGLTATLNCRPPGPVVPRPYDLLEQKTFTDATATLSSLFDSAMKGEIEAGWMGVENTSFSLAVVALDQPGGPGAPLWEYHHLSENVLPNGTQEISKDSQYLIGSISKVFSDYILFKSGLDPGRPVTDFIPELAGATAGDASQTEDGKPRIGWTDITLQMLADHTSGIPPNYGFSEYYFIKQYFLSLGFPPVPDSDFPPCGTIGLNGDCTLVLFLKGMLDSAPVSRPEERPSYSNIAFPLIMLAVENQTGKNYSQLLDEYVVKPFGLTNTMVSPGVDERAVIPPGMSAWGGSYGINAPGGGLVSSLSDLSNFFYRILDRSILDSPTDVRGWLKPTSFTGSPFSAVGTPWEIYRAQNLTPEHPHTVDIYAKGGAAYGYQSQSAIIDEYGVTIILLTAGGPGAFQVLYDAALTVLVPAIDSVARAQADNVYVGTFVNDAAGGDEVSFNVTFIQDEHSLLLGGVQRNGSDMVAAFIELWAVTMGPFVPVSPSRARLFPLDVKTNATVAAKDCPAKYVSGGAEEVAVVREDWRLDWEMVVAGSGGEGALTGPVKSDLPGTGMDGASKDNCLSWSYTDWMHYGGEAMDRVVFVRDAKTGDVLGVDLPYLRSGLLPKVKLLEE